jgi:hypothetical protein
MQGQNVATFRSVKNGGKRAITDGHVQRLTNLANNRPRGDGARSASAATEEPARTQNETEVVPPTRVRVGVNANVGEDARNEAEDDEESIAEAGKKAWRIRRRRDRLVRAAREEEKREP